MKSLTIGKLAKETGVKITTIRYYESIKLLDEPSRSESGQRLYNRDAVERLAFVRHARDLGFSIEAIRELISLQVAPGEDCAAIDRIAKRNLEEVRGRITRLKALEGELKHMIAACAGGKVTSCAVLSTLGDHQHCLHDRHEGVEVLATPPSKK